MKQHKVRPMADIVINHRVGTTRGNGGRYNRYDGIPLSWDERAVTSCTGGLVMKISYTWHKFGLHDAQMLTSLNFSILLYFRVVKALGTTLMGFQILIIANILFERIL